MEEHKNTKIRSSLLTDPARQQILVQNRDRKYKPKDLLVKTIQDNKLCSSQSPQPQFHPLKPTNISPLHENPDLGASGIHGDGECEDRRTLRR